MKLAQKFTVRYIRTKFKLLAAISKRKAAEKAFDLFCTPMFRNLNDIPEIFEEAEKITLTFQSYRIKGYRWNKGGEKKLLILHGFESSVINFEKYVRAFVKKNYEVLAFDAPAHGRSSGKRINALIYRDFINHIYKQFGPVKSFMAHSLGGLALSIALAEMTLDEEQRVVLIAPATETRTAIDQFFHFIRLKDPEVRKEFEDIIFQMNDKPVSWYSVTRALKSVNASVLWIHDEEDQVTPIADVIKAKSLGMRNIQFVFTKGLGHSRIYRNPEIRQMIVDFL